jgi:hypothetical protein
MYSLVPLLAVDIVRSRELLSQYRDLKIGLADATIVAAAERLRVQRVLTHDHRHFRAVKPRNFSHFIILPADAP